MMDLKFIETTPLAEPPRLRLRSQVRFKKLDANAPDQILTIWSDTVAKYPKMPEWDERHGYCWPSEEEGMLILEIVHVAPASEAPLLYYGHGLAVLSQVNGLAHTHGLAALLAVEDFESSPFLTAP